MKLTPLAIALAGAFGLTACHDDHSYSGHRHYGYYGYSRPSHTTVVVDDRPRYGGYGYGHSTYRRNTTVVNNNTVVRNRTVKRNNNVVVVDKKKHRDHDNDHDHHRD